jgi:hypothetical protein
MDNKFDLNLRENVMLFQKKRVDLINQLLKLEGYDEPMDKTQKIYDKESIENADITFVNSVLNLKEGCRLIIENLTSDINLDLLISLNREIGRDDSFDWGVIRNSRLFLDGTSYVPQIPTKENIDSKLKELLEIETPLERAIYLLVYLLKENIFWGRNISLAFIISNKIMIENGCGIIMVKSSYAAEFKVLLKEYLEDDSKQAKLIGFIYDNLIDGEKISNR